MNIKNLALFLAIGALSQLSVSVVNASGSDDELDEGPYQSTQMSSVASNLENEYFAIINQIYNLAYDRNIEPGFYENNADTYINYHYRRLSCFVQTAAQLRAFIERNKTSDLSIVTEAQQRQKECEASANTIRTLIPGI